MIASYASLETPVQISPQEEQVALKKADPGVSVWCRGKKDIHQHGCLRVYEMKTNQSTTTILLHRHCSLCATCSIFCRQSFGLDCTMRNRVGILGGQAALPSGDMA